MEEIAGLLSREGFRVEQDLDIGLVRVDVYGEAKRSLCLYPYTMHCYVFVSRSDHPLSVTRVVGYHAAAMAYTDVFKNRRSRWLRLRVPVTISTILARHGFDKQAIEHVQHKQRYQMGHANCVALVNPATHELHTNDKAGFVGGLPLSHANRLIKKIVSAGNGPAIETQV